MLSSRTRLTSCTNRREMKPEEGNLSSQMNTQSNSIDTAKQRDRKKIFVASSEEGKDVAKVLGASLEAVGFQITYWFRDWGQGVTNIDALERHANQVFGAVFILTEDDEAVVRGTKCNIPRDNVVFEFGLFFGKLGRNRAVAVLQNKAKTPTDFTGLSHEKFDRDVLKFPQTVRHLVEQRDLSERLSFFPKSPAKDIPIFTDDSINQILLESFPKRWADRRLYVGLRGAKHWLSMADAEITKAHSSSTHWRNVLVKQYKGIAGLISDFSFFISLGPGDASIDEKLLIEATLLNPYISYIPVDINYFLVRQSIERLSGNVHIPFGLTVDFEEQLQFIFAKVSRGGPDSRVVLALIGNTVANLDKGEATFFQKLWNHLRAGDAVILDACFMGAEWSPQTDSRLKISSYERPYREFLAVYESWSEVDAISTIADEFERRYFIDSRDGSDVPGSKVIEVRKKGERTVIARLTRFNMEEMKQWLTGIGFKVSVIQVGDPKDVTYDAILLLRK